MKYLLLSAALLAASIASAQTVADTTLAKIGEGLTAFANREVKVGRVKIDSAKAEKKNLKLYASEGLSFVPLYKRDVDSILASLKSLVPEYKTITLFTDGQPVENLILFNRKKKDLFANKVTTPLLTRASKPYILSKGLQNRHLAMWQSHGWYYEQKLGRWEWQRARIFQTVEDIYTQSYVLPYLVPMLENAGAYVFLPRERDTQKHEIIVDNDKSSGVSNYKETSGTWQTGSAEGFAHLKQTYLDGENPFAAGTYRETKTVKKGEESVCEWTPDIPEKGEYAVYISYKSFPKSTENAQYTVEHLGGKTEFLVNQKMGGGTWIFLGFFTFDKGINECCKVVLTNKSNVAGRIITADAVKIGGGMGNIARLPHAETLAEQQTGGGSFLQPIRYEPLASGYPRYTEGSRYWLQWAGAPDSVYNRSAGKNDYTDDYQSRAFWVNYLAGGSEVLPKRGGLNVPIDMSMAFHSDAGTTFNDSIIGTLGIYMTHFNDEKFENGKTRWTSRDLTNSITNEIVNDIRREYEPAWRRRHLWNRSYAEARIPNVPTMLLELLSHQNFADMKYGLDPAFRFTVSRSIYKGILKFEAQQYGFDYVVQPLPVKAFGAYFIDETIVRLVWKPVEDDAEPTASPDKYILYTRIDDGAFDNGVIVNGTNTTVYVTKDHIYSFKVSALNAGGESFPSEILAVCRKSDEKGRVLIVNGFDRVSAPYSFATKDSIGGFVDFIDHGVPDIKEYNYIGSQYEFRRRIPWMDDDAAGFGASNANYETTVLAGNTHDYAYMHGKSILAAGYSFVSANRDAVIQGFVGLGGWRLVDLILGKQRQTRVGRGVFPARFKTFPKDFQKAITDYCSSGGNIFVSGAFVASDLWDDPEASDADKDFATRVLGYKWRVGRAAVEGKVKSVPSPFPALKGDYEFHTQLNTVSYAAESPDAIEPGGKNSFTVFRYSENNLSAGVASRKDNYSAIVMGFPFETIKDASARDSLMKSALEFLSDSK